MKLGWIGTQPQKNVLKSKPGPDWFATSPQGMFHMLYPDKDSALIDIENPDYELCAKMDAIFYWSGTHTDHLMLKVIDKIPCKVLTCHEGGEHDFLRWPLDIVLINRQVIDKSDLLLVWDTRALGLHELYTETPVLWWPLPYPIEYIDRALAVKPDDIYNILVAYGPSVGVRSPRNSIAGCLLAERIINSCRDYNAAGVFSGGYCEADDNFLYKIGCNAVEAIPYVDPKRFLSMINYADLVINLDTRRASGRITLECALTKTPVIATDQQPFAHQLYSGIKLHDSYDINSMINTGVSIHNGGWLDEWLDLAYERAQHYSYTNKAKVLEEAVLRL